MKHLLLFLSLLVTGLSASMGCTNLIVGKKASADGSVMCTYNCDAFGMAGWLNFIPAAAHDKDELIAIRGWGPRHEGRYVRQVPYTHKVVGLMNDHQLTIVETTFDGRLELVNPDGLLDYFSLMKLALQRCTTAREAVRCMAELVEEYGYNSSGESFAICDPDEAWIMEMIGKGSDRKGAVWVAMRLPDDCICAYANMSRICQFPLKDKENCLYSKDVVSFAREKGYFSGRDQDFSWRDAYCPIDFENVRYGEARVWSFFNRHNSQMSQYLPFIQGDFSAVDRLPLWVRPDHKISVRDLQNSMRDHYEGTPLDMSRGASAGPWNSPIRPLPMHMVTSDSTRLFRERSISTQQVGWTMVCQMRSWLPNEVGGITYFNLDDPDMVAYVPIYCGVERVPDPFLHENNMLMNFDWQKSAWWRNNVVANIVYPRYRLLIRDLRDAQRSLEDYFEAEQPSVDSAASAMTVAERTDYLSRLSCRYTDTMMARWEQLARLLVVKYNDQVEWHYDGRNIDARRYVPAGYGQDFIDVIGREEADHYKEKVVIDRRLR